jgi:hypothetical protein
MRHVDGEGVRKRRAENWQPSHAGWRRPRVIGAVVIAIAIAAAGVRLIQHPVYSAGSPKVRVTVSGGCPKSLGAAIDVSNPGPNRWSEFWGYSRLARSGATTGLACQYTPAQPGYSQSIPTDGPPPASSAVPEDATALANVPPAAPPILQAQAVLTRAQAEAVSLAAFTQSTLHPSGTFHCPGSPAGVTIVALGYAHGPDTDIWWNNAGCQSADNGHVQVYFYGAGLSGGDFSGAVEKVLPSAP